MRSSAPTTDSAPPIWAIVPAAGIGARFGGQLPKQYAELHGQTVLQRGVETLLRHPRIKGCVIALAGFDPHFSSITFASLKPIMCCRGGSTRADSVRAALIHLQNFHPESEQWVAVHDAARPCLSDALLDSVLKAALSDPVGALLALPISDTIKRKADSGLETLDRRELWAAHTPQVFRSQSLLAALEVCDRTLITDEAQAMELIGLTPTLVPSAIENLKITQPSDLMLAEHHLRHMRG